jgi:phosphoribosyl 1,2-cyclic phosphodiesterase
MTQVARMSMELCVLASGSSGNCSVVRTPTGVFLIDCGIGPRVTAGRLIGTGVSLSQVAAVCLTHLDRDHFNPAWAATLIHRQIRVYCPADRVHELLGYVNDEQLRPLVVPFQQEPFEPLPGVIGKTLRLAHDRTGSHAFHFSSEHGSIGYATDLGNVPETLTDHFCGVDLLAIESNYDPHMQRTSGRPLFLQKRIMGGGGHLSNEQSFKAVRAIFDRCGRRGHALPRQVVLLHRSRQCNCPDLLKNLFSADSRVAPRLVLSEQFERTDWLSATRSKPWVGEQLHFILSEGVLTVAEGYG